MGNVLRPFRTQESVSNHSGAATSKNTATASAEESKVSEHLTQPPPSSSPLQKQLSKSNAASHQKKGQAKQSAKKQPSSSKDRTAAKPKQAPSTADKDSKPKLVAKRPLRTLRRDLRSRTKFKVSKQEPITGPSTRSSTRNQAPSLPASSAASSAASSSASSNAESQDEAKSTSSSDSRKPRPRMVKEKLGTKRKSNPASASSTSGEEREEDGHCKPKKAKVQAQRKFAYPLAYSPGCTPSKVQNGGQSVISKASNIFDHCPSTEDFLTFLCLRGTSALPPSLDLFKVQKQPTPTTRWPGLKKSPRQKQSSGSSFDGIGVGEDVSIAGIEPLPLEGEEEEDSSTPTATPTATPPRSAKASAPRSNRASPALLQQKLKLKERRLRLDARQFKASGKLTKNLRNSFKTNQKSILGSTQQLPPSLSPVPPPILAIPHNRHPPPLIPIIPWENKRCQANSSKDALRPSRKTNAKASLGRSSGRTSGRNNCVPLNNTNHRLANTRDQTPTATSTAKSCRKKEAPKNRHSKLREKQGRKSDRLKLERRGVLNGSNHVLEKLEGPANGHTLLSQIKLLKGTRRERKEKKCSCHSQDCSLKVPSKHKNGDRDLAIDDALEEVLKTAKRQKKLKEFKRRSSRKLRNSSMMLRDRVQAVEMEDSLLDKADAMNTILSTNGISKKLTIPLTNCTLNNNVLRKDSMISPKPHLNCEIERKLTELKIKEDEEEMGEKEATTQSKKVRNPLLLKNDKEMARPKVTAPAAPQRKSPKKSQAQAPKRNRTKNGLSPARAAKQDVPTGPCEFVKDVQEGLVLRPSPEEWSDPVTFMESIAEQLSTYGICRVIPPDGWKPECKLHVNTRFTTEVQYIHRLRHRWKSRSKQLACIKRHLEERDKVAYNPPQIYSCEIDLVEFSKVVAQQGGLKTINSNKRWNKVADLLHIPKSIQGRVSRLDSVYCKYLLSYDTLSKEEKQKLEIETELLRKQQVARLRSQNTEVDRSEEVVCKGRPTTLSNYCRMAGLSQQMHCRRTNASPESIENDYWQMLDLGEPHVAIHTGQLNATLSASGFTTNRANMYAKHNWNCKNVGKNRANVLHLLPGRLRVNVPELKLSMLYGTEGWLVDGQGLAQLEFLHTGSAKIWYGVPASHCNNLQHVLQSDEPRPGANEPHCLYKQNLHCMVPPSVLAANGIPVYRLLQQPGEFIIVAQGAARSTLCTGYSMSEGIPFASPSSLQHCFKAFEISRELKQPTLFSLEHLLCILAKNAATDQIDPHHLRELRTELAAIRDTELSLRQQLFAAGLKSSICFTESETPADGQSAPTAAASSAKNRSQHASEKGCYTCHQLCYLSMVVNEREDRVYCLRHALQVITKTTMSGRNFKLLYRYSESQLRDLVASLECSNSVVDTVSSSAATSASTSATQATTTTATSASTRQVSETSRGECISTSVATTSTTTSVPASLQPPPMPPAPTQEGEQEQENEQQQPQPQPQPPSPSPSPSSADSVPQPDDASSSPSCPANSTVAIPPSESRLRKK
ncbi:uncharacterized protein [Diadema antillarum]|uniref:uncharacterized protein isoform X2 n=1 Tax=Diadema antillarum TaxID=105358 RepID=UPI003A87D074